MGTSRELDSMSKGTLDTLMQDLHRIAGFDALREHADADLLARFANHRDESAFAALVSRHGGLVFGVCKRMLPSVQDTEDAFQATFLTLARKADSISNKESLAAWLYRVAYRIALRVRKQTPRHDVAVLNDVPARDAGNDLEKREILQSLDEAISQLPTSSARAIVLCYFEGKTHEEAALVLGCPKGTLASWIARARQHLHDRLTRRGCALSAAGLATLLSEQASAAPGEWIPPTAKAAVVFVSGTTATGVLSTQAVVLSEGMLRIMWFNKLKMFAAIVMLLATFGVGTGFLLNSVWGGVDAAPVQGDAHAEIAKLRDEIAKLRAELKDAIREIKSLKDAMPEKDASATYRGKPATFWLGQLNDADAKFRKEATEAISNLSKKNKKLVPVLLQVLKDESDSDVALQAAYAYGSMATNPLPDLIEIAKDKSLDYPKYQRQSAIEVIGTMKAEAKTAVPVLAQILREPPQIGTMRTTLDALHRMGADAKEAIPALVDTLELCLRDIGRKSDRTLFGTKSQAYMNGVVISTLQSIDPSVREVLPQGVIDGRYYVLVDKRKVLGADEKEIEQRWRQALDVLKKKYSLTK